MTLQIKRIFETATSEDGMRILVDRIWPRGVSKLQASIDEWIKDIAPSKELRMWFNHIPDRFEVFKTRYKIELKDKNDILYRIYTISQNQNVTLLYSAKDEIHNHAIVLVEIIENLKK